MYIIDKRLICRNIHKLNMFSLRKIALIINVSHMTVNRWIEKDENDILKSHYDQINRKKIKSSTPDHYTPLHMRF